MDVDKQGELLRAKINGETARMQWSDLERFFASGAVIAVSDTLDLVEVAWHIAQDDAASVSRWMAENLVSRVTDEQARAWHEGEVSLWTVVVKPWILVQREKMH